VRQVNYVQSDIHSGLLGKDVNVKTVTSKTEATILINGLDNNVNAWLLNVLID